MFSPQLEMDSSLETSVIFQRPGENYTEIHTPFIPVPDYVMEKNKNALPVKTFYGPSVVVVAIVVVIV